MGRKMNRFSVWLRRQSHIWVLLVCGAVVLLLFCNKETSMAYSRELDANITTLTNKIKAAKDTAEYYKNKRQRLLNDSEDIEKVARENYGMQRFTEDVYIVEP